MANVLSVGIADMKICRAPDSIITYALGSCIGIIMYDPVLKLCGMVHIMLPNCVSNPVDNIFKYADTGIVEMLRKLEVFGAVKRRLIIKIAGGARMFEVSRDSIFGTIGQRNIETTKMVLNSLGFYTIDTEVGGTVARTLTFIPSTGKASVRAPGEPEKYF